MKIGVIDGDIDKEHIAFSDVYSIKKKYFSDNITDRDITHGTSVLGVICGNNDLGIADSRYLEVMNAVILSDGLASSGNLKQAMAEEERLLQDIEDGKYTDEELEKIELPTDKIFNNKQNQVTTAEELAETPIVMTDLATNSEREIDPSDGVASYAWAIPVGIYITRQVATQLLKRVFAAVIGGVLGAALTLISVNVNYRKYYEHYRVVRTGKVGLVVLGGMNLNTAVNYLKIRGDVWSISQPLAWRVAYFAGTPRGGKFQQPTKAERHGGPGNFYHHHTWNRAGGHSFYGTAR